MLFNSVEYVLLLLVALAGYWATKNLLIRQCVVLISSVYFYMSWSIAFGAMLLCLIGVNWGLGLLIQKYRRKSVFVAACVLNVGLLAYFKYTNFLIDNLTAIAHAFGSNLHIGHYSIILPLGISFYTFEIISYHTDIYRGTWEHQKNPLVFAIFVLFFPHLIAGPICRSSQFMPQVSCVQKPQLNNIYNGTYMFICGLALKSGIADGLAPYVNVIFDNTQNYTGFDNLFALFGFGIQILCDFWGYSLMALGAALLFSYTLPHNFNMPYASLSIKDFWRRWHMTLSNWLRDYLYIALGGSRMKSELGNYRNLFLTMLLGGLWHGASWNFVIWGGIHGGALAVNRWFSNLPPNPFKTLLSQKIVAWLVTMSVVFVAWVFFRAHTLDSAISMIFKIVTINSDWHYSKLAYLFFEVLAISIPIMALAHYSTFKNKVSSMPAWLSVTCFTVMTAFATIYYVDGSEFIYFQF